MGKCSDVLSVLSTCSPRCIYELQAVLCDSLLICLPFAPGHVCNGVWGAPQLWEGQWASLGSTQPLGALRTCFGYCLVWLWFQHWWRTGAMNT